MNQTIKLLIATIFISASLHSGSDGSIATGKTSSAGWCKPQKSVSIVLPDTSKIRFMNNGINYIDINHDGTSDMVISGFRNNISAHVFSYYTFYVSDTTSGYDKTKLWNIVEIENKNNPDADSRYDITTQEGADGILTDIAYIKDKYGNYQLLKADREFGSSYADAGKVTFTYFKLKFDSTESRYIYQVALQKVTQKKYVDVREAIESELR